MTRRLYAVEPQGHGGKRRHQTPPALSPAEVAQVRAMRANSMSYKALERIFGVSRYTLSWAVNGRRTYRSYFKDL